MLKTYGVLGTGSTSKNVIEDALNELGEDNDYLLDGPRKLSASELRVYEWMCAHEVAYTLIHNDNTSEDLLESASQTIRCKALSNEFFLKELKKRKGTLLLLWDQDRVEEMEEIVFLAADLGIEIKDLTNGLEPITVGEEEEEPTKPTLIPTEEVEVEPFDRKELEGMPLSVLKKAMAAKGQNVNNFSKNEMVDFLANPHQRHPDAAPNTTIPNVEVVYEKKAEKRPQLTTTDDKPCMATIVLPNGTVTSLPISMAEAKTILGLG